MSKQIVILGSINYDITASAERLPARGETVAGFSVDMFGGGKGANQAVQSAQMGVPTAMIGQVGNEDVYKRQLLVQCFLLPYKCPEQLRCPGHPFCFTFSVNRVYLSRLFLYSESSPCLLYTSRCV